MKEISVDTLKKMNCETFSKKSDTPRGIEIISKSQIQVGDKVVIDNYFTLVTEPWKALRFGLYE